LNKIQGQRWSRRVANRSSDFGSRVSFGFRTSTLGFRPSLRLARNLRHQIDQAIGPVRSASPVTEIPAGEYHDQVQDWQGSARDFTAFTCDPGKEKVKQW